MCFGGKTKVPDVPPVPAAPALMDATSKEGQAITKAAKEKNARKALLAGGQGSTVMTGASGLTDPAQVQKKALLGN